MGSQVLNAARLLPLYRRSYASYVANILKPTAWWRFRETSGSIAKNSAYTGGIGAELLTNGDFSAWTADNPDGWTVSGESGTDPEISEVGAGEGHGGSGTGYANIFTSSVYVVMTQGVLTLGNTYRDLIDVNLVTSGSVIREIGGANTGSAISTAGQKTLDFIAGGGTTAYGIKRNAACDVTINSASVKKIGELDAANTAATVGQTGKLGANEAYDLDGATSLLTVTNRASIQGLTEATILFLAKPDTTGEATVGTFVHKNTEFILRFSAGKLRGQVDYSTTSADSSSADNIPLGQWGTFGLRWNDTDKKAELFMNGVNVTPGSPTVGVGTKVSNTTNIVIGNVASAAQTFDGLMDEVILVNRALTDAQILQWHQLTGV